MARVLVTGSAGFIGYHVSKALIHEQHQVLGIDNLNDYYDVQLKLDRIAQIGPEKNFDFHTLDICNQEDLKKSFHHFSPEYIVHLAAQAGVRHSLNFPDLYVSSNIQGTLNLLELCRHSKTPIKHFTYASTSSVYGLNRSMPFKTTDPTNHPVSLYAATKKSTELIAHAYSHLFRIPTTALRFFTVYGPWGRPDMAIYLFTKAIIEDKPIKLYNFGDMRRDFTFIDDVVQGLLKATLTPAQADLTWDEHSPAPCSSNAPFRVFNIGNHRSESLETIVRLLEESIGKSAIIERAPLQPGDVIDTFADISDLQTAAGYQPETNIDTGIKRFVEWYRSYYC